MVQIKRYFFIGLGIIFLINGIFILYENIKYKISGVETIGKIIKVNVNSGLMRGSGYSVNITYNYKDNSGNEFIAKDKIGLNLVQLIKEFLNFINLKHNKRYKKNDPIKVVYLKNASYKSKLAETRNFIDGFISFLIGIYSFFYSRKYRRNHGSFKANYKNSKK